jgi:hypothetical protein
LSRLRRSAKSLIVIGAVLTAALVLSACAYFKPGSLSVTQPAGVGAVNLHFALCTKAEPEISCQPNKEDEELQYLLGVAVPRGSTAPPTLTAVPSGGGSPIVFTRNEAVAPQLAASSVALENEFKAEEPLLSEIAGFQAWPPPGLEAIGYISNPVAEKEGEQNEWNVDGQLPLPVPAEGAPYPGPFEVALSYGFRLVGPGLSPDRPVQCASLAGEPSESTAFCLGTGLDGRFGTSDLKLGGPAKATAFVGGQAKIEMPLRFASSAGVFPAFSLAGASSLSKAKVKLSPASFAPGAPDPSTHNSPPGSTVATVTVPKNAKPGTYDVTVNATAVPGGGIVSQVVKLKVTRPTLKLGGVTLNKSNGTATLKVKIPGAGTLTATGKGIAKAKKSAKQAKKPKTVKLTIKANGKAKTQLAEEGTAKVSVKVKFKPLSGTSVTKTKKITLKQN